MNNLLFIPVYNCEKQISRVLNKLVEEQIDQYFTEILIVDNISTDKTLENIIKFKSKNDLNLKLIQNKENYNLGGSHKVAFEYMLKNNFNYIMVLHGDDQADVKDIHKFFNTVSIKKYDKVLGARFKKDSIITGYSKVRVLGNIILNKITGIMMNYSISDLGSGMNMYSNNFIRKKFYIDCADNLTFNNHLIFCDYDFKVNTIFVPINWFERDQISNAKLLSQTREILYLSIKRFINRNKKKELHSRLCCHISHEYIEINL